MTEAAVLEPGLRARMQALLRLIRDDPAVDRELAFSYVLWPTDAVEAALPGARGRNVSAAEVERMAELAAQGMTHRQIGERLGRPRATVSDALRRNPCATRTRAEA
jgi:Helix-turn-helix domain